MVSRFLSLIFVLGSMALVVHLNFFQMNEPVSLTLVLGFLLLAAYCVGALLEGIGLPMITGCILAGVLLGPYYLSFYDQAAIKELAFIDSLALAFIAFCAGGELRLEDLKSKIKSIVYLLLGVTFVVFIGVTGVVFLISGFIPFMAKYSLFARLAIASIFGVIAVARSPSSTIAIINETKAHGRYTNTVLSVTIATDVVIIMAFAVVISLCQIIVAPSFSFDFVFVISLIIEIIIAFCLGFLLGKAIIYLIERVGVEFPIVIVGMGFLVIKFSHFLGDHLKSAYDMSLNLEPLLICMAAGYTVQNYSKHGRAFLGRLNRVALPIYVAFFAITGASINVDVLKTSWLLGLIIVVARIVMLYVGSFFSGRLSGDPPRIYNNTWLGFITQAGVSLGLLAEVVRRFPELGVSIQSILVAAITLNQIIGPVAFKYALNKVGEANKTKRFGFKESTATKSV